jgi:NAD(P)-dependent dehydrogenase (short-subunit alcohol dehydrogenase family)
MGILDGKKALVTGSRRGIGAAIALKLAAEGADVGVNDIARDDDADKTMAAISGLGRRFTWHQADIGESAERERMFDEFLEAHGRIDILVNNAVLSRDVNFLDVTEEFFDHLIGHALKGYVFASQRAAKEMIAQGDGGKIVSISSVHSYRAWPNDSVYGIAKAGLNRMAKSLALDLAGTGINVNCVAPGYIDSRVLTLDQEPDRGGRGYADYAMKEIPSRRGGLPVDIANAVLFLSSDMANYVNGETILVDGGLLSGGTPS